MLTVLKWARVFRHVERSAALYSAVAKEELEDDFGADTSLPPRRNTFGSLRPLQYLASFSITARVSVGLAMILMISLVFRATPTHRHTVAPTSKSNFFHLLIPATAGGVKLCKTLFSAAALDYPTPRLVNWALPPSDRDWFNGTHIAKISGTLDYLDSLGPKSEDELVLIVDGYDLWFQLRPSVLIDRYYRYLDRQNARIHKRLGRAMEKEGIYQTIIMASGAGCWPQEPESPTCYLVPDSELPHDVYGELTDDPSGLTRPRWVNSGFIMGPAGDVRKIIKRALDCLNINANIGSDQFAFNLIFAQQEYQREVMRERHLSPLQRMTDSVNKFLGHEDERSKLVLGANTTLLGVEQDVDYEYHLGLDYTGELTWTVDGSYGQMAWLTYSSLDDIAKLYQERGIPPPVRVTHLPEDIAHSDLPFNISSPQRGGLQVGSTGSSNHSDDNEHHDDNHALVPQSWASVPLYTSLFTGAVSPAIHIGPKELLESEWDKTWFFPQLREHLSARVLARRTPVAVTADQQQWWSSIDSKGGVMAETASTPKWLSWGDLCGSEDDANELFRDKKGPWVDPRSKQTL